jgi:hypothetical protein
MPICLRWTALCLLGCVACNQTSDHEDDAGMTPPAITPGTGGVAAMPMGTGGIGSGSGGAPTQSMMATGSGGSAAMTGTGGSTMAPIDAGHHDSGSGGAPQTDAATDAGALDGAASNDPLSFAAGLDQLFMEAPCDPSTPTPLAQMATCQHPSVEAQHIEMKVTFGGDPSVVYALKLRIRGIWEPTKIDGGERPIQGHPFTIGGMVASGTDPINYQQWSIKVSKPEQVYWLNDHQYVAHDIHKEDYEATLQVTGGAEVTVIMNDGNDHEIANWTKDYFEGLPPYDTMPSLGQTLRLDVVSVTAQ